MINTIFHFVNDPTFDYQTAVNNGDISEYTIVFNSADHSIRCKGTMFGRMSRSDMAETLGNISDLIPVATDSTLGGIKIGYTNNADLNSRRYGVVLDSNNKAYVEVPWTDTITPDFDDTELKSLIATERSRIDNFISTLSDTIDAKNRQLFADTQWVEEVFGIPQAEGSIWQKFENEIDHYLNEYMVWDWVDPNDHTKGRTAKISSIELDIDGITTRVGSAESSIDGLTTTTSTLTQRADAIETRVGAVETKADGIDTALSSFEQTVNTEIGGIKTAQTNLSSSVASYESTNDGNIGNLVKMAASVLDLKASANAQGQLTSTADLASVITNGSFTGYSGLASKVQEIDGAYVSQASLTSQIQALDISGQIATATSGLASESYVRTTAASEADDAESAAKGYADTVAASATATMYATVDEVCAGIGVTVTKDTNGAYTSVAQISADNINLNGQTNFKTAVGAFIKTDVLEAGTATINAATIDSATITGTLSGVDGTFTGALNAATGTFTGDVNASSFTAGNDNGFSISVESTALQFNWQGNPLAWFSLCGWDDTNNTFATPAANPQGFYLYMRNPLDGHMITIDFTNLTFKDLNANSNPVYTYKLYSITRLNGNIATDPVVSEDRDVYYTDVNGTKTWYSNSQGTTALTSVSGYRKFSPNASQGPNMGSPMYNPHILKARTDNNTFDLLPADIYISQTFSNGQVVDGTDIIVIATDTNSHKVICRPLSSGNPKTVNGASNVYYRGYLSNNWPSGHRDISSQSAYVMTAASTSDANTFSSTVTFFDNNNRTTSMLATNYPT